MNISRVLTIVSLCLMFSLNAPCESAEDASQNNIGNSENQRKIASLNTQNLFCPSDFKEEISWSIATNDIDQLRAHINKIENELGFFRKRACKRFLQYDKLFVIAGRASKKMLSLMLQQSYLSASLKDRHSQTLLHMAAYYGNIENALLLVRDPDIDINHQADSAISILSGKPYFGVNDRRGFYVGHTPLVQAVYGYHYIRWTGWNLSILKLLLEHPDIDLNYMDNDTVITPLIIAVMNRSYTKFEVIMRDVVTFELIKRGADPNLQVQHKEFKTTALIEAVRSKNKTAILFLRHHTIFGVDTITPLDVSLTDTDGKTAFDIASESEDVDILEILKANRQQLNTMMGAYCQKNKELLLSELKPIRQTILNMIEVRRLEEPPLPSELSLKGSALSDYCATFPDGYMISSMSVD